MKIEYKTVNINTVKGLKQAEKLQKENWKIGNVGFSTIQFFREKTK